MKRSPAARTGTGMATWEIGAAKVIKMVDGTLPENAEHGITASALVLIKQDDDRRPRKVLPGWEIHHPGGDQAQGVWRAGPGRGEEALVVEDILAARYAD